MSLILEALKKSEARRQLGEAPGLGTPFTVARRRRSPLPIIVILILVAVGFGWYYLRTTPPAASAGRTTASNASAGSTVTATASKPTPRAVPATTTGAETGANRDAPGASPRAPATGEVTARPAPFGTPGMRGDPRARGVFNQSAAAGQPNRSGDPGAGRQAHLMPAMPGAVSAAPNLPPETRAARARNTVPDSAPPPATPAQAAQPQAPRATAKPTVPAAAVAQTAMTTTTPNAAMQPPAAPAAAASAASAQPAPAAANSAPDLPLYYELPFNLRKDLPTLAVSMHVYAVAPAQRFVVIDGERRAEGEVVKEGLTLREIRSDGIVLDLRGQRFFYPRPGR